MSIAYHKHRLPDSLGLDFMLVDVTRKLGVWELRREDTTTSGHCHTDQSAKTLLEAMIKILKTTDLGIVQSVGFVAETAGVENQLLKTGHLPLSETKVIGLVEHSIRKLRRSVRTSQIDSRTIRRRRSRWSYYRVEQRSERIAQAKTAEEATAAVQQAVVAKVSDMFVLQESDINPGLPLSEYGVDSLVAVELRNWLVPNARIEMSIFNLLGSPSLIELAKSVVKRSKSVFTTIQ
ncbi:hypothetical protein CHU98_g10864 [Xylaria longipes]|nr:hypothetical protein CHU98_g10864 [Xylaria longipes]